MSGKRLTPTVLLLAVSTVPAQEGARVAPAPSGKERLVAPSFAERSARRAAFADAKTVEAIRSGLRWLIEHQDDDGKWDADGFAAHDPAQDKSTGPGNGVHDIGATSLALLALLAQDDPSYAEVSMRAADWLAGQFDADTGRVPAVSHDYVYGQALAILALAEASAILGVRRHGDVAAAGLRCLETHRNPGAAWRYQPRDDDNDSSVTSWCLAAYAAARDAGLPSSATGAGEALAWLDSVTDPATGHCSYGKLGETSSRHAGEHMVNFPPGATALTGAALHARLVLGLLPTAPVAENAHTLLSTHAPSDDPKQRDFYSWCHTSMAVGMRTAAGVSSRWESALRKVLLDLQVKKGTAGGSWNPDDCWGEDGGRVCATALNVLALSGPYRLGRQDLVASIPPSTEFRELQEACRSERFGAASRILTRMEAAALGPAAAAARVRVAWLVETERSRAAASIQRLRGDRSTFSEQLAELERTASRWEGHDLGASAYAELEALRKDPSLKREVTALQEFAKLKAEGDKLLTRGSKSQLLKLVERVQKFAAKNTGSMAEAKATELVRVLQQQAQARS